MSEYRVMVPLDGSKAAEHSLAYLDSLRSIGASRVLLLSVADDAEDFHGLTGAEGLEKERNLLEAYLANLAGNLRGELGIDVETKVVTGSPSRAILAEADAFAPDLMVLSTHGRSGPSRWRIGSVADKVIRGSTYNTLVVGPHATGREAWLEDHLLPGFRSILIPLDGSKAAERALEVTRTFRDAFSPKIHLVDAVSVPPIGDAFGETSYMPELLTTLEDGAGQYLNEVAARMGDTSEIVLSVPVGPAASCLTEYVEREHIDLVVMTTHGRGGFARATLGSVTDRMLGGAAPVLIVRSGRCA